MSMYGFLPPLGQLLVIVEYCAGGNLLQHLRKKRQDSLDPLTTLQQIKMALQVSRGMAFLSTQKVREKSIKCNCFSSFS